MQLTSTEHGYEHDPARPQVARPRVVRVLHEHLGRDVGHGAAAALQGALAALVAEHGGHAKVGQLEDVAVREEQVLGFDVAMGDPSVVEVALEKKQGKMHLTFNIPLYVSDAFELLF